MKFKMKFKKIISLTLKKIIYENIFVLLLFMLTLLLLRIFHITYKIKHFNYFFIITLFFLGIGIYKLFLLIKAYQYRLRLSVISGVLIILICSVKFNSLKDYAYKLLNYYDFIQKSFYYSKETYFFQYVPFLTICIPILTAIILYLNSKGKGNIILIISLIYLLSIWYSAELIAVKLYVIVYIVLFSLTYCYNKQKNFIQAYKKEGIKISINKNKILQYVLVVSLSVSLFSYVSVEKFGYKSAAARISELLSKSKKMQELSLNNRYDLSYSGYLNETKKLGGPIVLSYERVLKVKSDEAYYLKGTAKDYYDGFKWSKTSENYERKTNENIRGLSDKFNRYLQGTLKDKLEKADTNKITIYPEGIETSTLFSPSFTFNIKPQKGYLGYDDTGSFILLGNSNVKYPYTVEFYKSTTGLELFSKAYENNIPISDAFEEKDYMMDKYKKYLQKPDNISSDIYNLVKDITKNGKTNSDKVKSIQDYLSENYKYSLNVSEVPENKEFIEYFLFTEKKGYCTYFATASTIMCRIAGIPARYVEGFNMSDRKDSDGLYEVTNDMAHAWTEVLLDPEEDIWTIVDSVPEAAREIYSESQGNINNDKNYIGRYIEKNSGSKNSYKNESSAISFLKAVLWIFIIAFISVLIYIIYELKVFLNMKKNIISSNSSIPLYNYTKSRLSLLYDKKEIVNDDLLWIENINHLRLKESLRILSTASYEEFYGKKSYKELDKLKIYLFIESYIKENQNLFKYYFYKLINHKHVL